MTETRILLIDGSCAAPSRLASLAGRG